MDHTFISKYRPYFIDDFSLNDELLYVLKTLIQVDYLNILFIGSSSSGKTTLLYALIREYYGLSKDANFPENNILFVNNLKEQGIQYFRNEMKTFCQSRSVIHGKKKLVIIDDIDNINEQSQQVFRNYIDKYKQNIHFISVCTNIQKVIESIQSRVHILQITLPTNEQIRDIMNKIIKAENIVIDEPAKDYLLLSCGNSIRILINYLEKIYILNMPINIDICKKICSNISFQRFEEYLTHFLNGELAKAIDVLYSIYDYGYSVIDILDYFFIFIKTTTMLDEDTKYKIIPFLCKYITIFHNVHEDGIELALFTNNLMEHVKK
uniref:AAA+ ATPase domain-containing protein n=1 Tax=viral metagenome TaxID=1070528 RepID=A0A6C0ARJ7_9ZZZZ